MPNIVQQRWLPGRQIGGKYTLVHVVGHGGMSEVWSAKNEMTGAHVALKLLHNAASDVDLVARFRHEAMVGAQLEHRNIASVYDFLCEPDGTLALVMALLRGKSVEDRLHECVRMSQREAVAVALGALAALEHAHESGILHRDIKPGNVFLSVDSDGLVTPKLLDFGIAKLPEGGVQTRDGTFLGTPQYMAPERVRDMGNVDVRSDLFSIGLLLFEMLSGKSPFERPSPQASLVAVLEDEVERDLLISPQMWDLIRRLLAKRPADRPGSAAEVIEALHAATGHRDFTLQWEHREVDKFRVHSASSPRLPLPTPSSERRIHAVTTLLEEEPLPRVVSSTPPPSRWPREPHFFAATVAVSAFILGAVLWKSSAAIPEARVPRGKSTASFPIIHEMRAPIPMEPLAATPNVPNAASTALPPPTLKKTRAPMEAYRAIGKTPDF